MINAMEGEPASSKDQLLAANHTMEQMAKKLEVDSLGLIALLAPAGRLGDAVGRKLIYTYGFVVFIVDPPAASVDRAPSPVASFLSPI